MKRRYSLGVSSYPAVDGDTTEMKISGSSLLLNTPCTEPVGAITTSPLTIDFTVPARSRKYSPCPDKIVQVSCPWGWICAGIDWCG